MLTLFIIFYRVSTFAQNPAGEYMGKSNPEIPFFENVKLVLLCNETFTLLDSAIKISGKWHIDHKWVLQLRCDTIQLTSPEVSKNKHLRLSFDIPNDGLIWHKSSIRDFQKLKFNDPSPAEINYNRRKWRENKLLKNLSYLPCP
jgi:hypothetical protein